MTLRARLALWTFASALLLAGAVTMLLALNAESARTAQLRAEGRRIALSAVTLYDVLRLTGSAADRATLQSFLGAAVRGTGPADALAYALVLDDAGRLVSGDTAIAGVHAEDVAALQTQLPRDVVGIDALVVARDSAAGDGAAADAPAGRVLVGVSTARVREALWSTVAFSALASFAIAAAVALLLFSVVTRRVVRPLAAVAAGMSAVRTGGREPLAPLPGRSDEAAALVDGFNDMIGALVEGERSHSALERHVGKRAAGEIVGGAVGTGKRAQVTALFFDVEGFGVRMGRDAPEDVVALLQDIVAIVIDVVHSHEGHVEKLMGDALLAVWGLPSARPGDEARAVRAALAIVERCQELSSARRARGQEAFAVGVGVASGEAVVATVGTEDRAETVVIGEPVVLARRIEEEAKALGFGVLIAEATFRAVSTSFQGAATPPVLVKGIGVPLTLYRVRPHKLMAAST